MNDTAAFKFVKAGLPSWAIPIAAPQINRSPKMIFFIIIFSHPTFAITTAACPRRLLSSDRPRCIAWLAQLIVQRVLTCRFDTLLSARMSNSQITKKKPQDHPSRFGLASSRHYTNNLWTSLAALDRGPAALDLLSSISFYQALTSGLCCRCFRGMPQPHGPVLAAVSTRPWLCSIIFL